MPRRRREEAEDEDDDDDEAAPEGVAGMPAWNRWDEVKYSDDAPESPSLEESFGQMVDLGAGESAEEAVVAGEMPAAHEHHEVAANAGEGKEGEANVWSRVYTHSQESAWLFGKSKAKRVRLDHGPCYLCDEDPDPDNRWHRTIVSLVGQLRYTHLFREMCSHIAGIYQVNLQPFMNRPWSKESIMDHVMRHRPSHTMILNDQLSHLRTMAQHGRRTCFPVDNDGNPLPFNAKDVAAVLMIETHMRQVSKELQKAIKEEQRGGK